MPGLRHIFINPSSPRQRQYEAIRAIEVENLSVTEAARQFHYSANTLYSLIRDIKAGKLEIFPSVSTHLKSRQTPDYICDQITHYRKQNLSSIDIKDRICAEGYKISVRTVERILNDANMPKLQRRTKAQLGLTQKMQFIPERATPLDFDKLEPFHIDCPVAGAFFFIPYILESGILDIVNKCQLPGSSALDATQANLSMLLLKLIGNERLSHIDAYNHEPGFGIFAGLTVLPKSSYITSYSCRTSEKMMLDFQKQLLQHLTKTYADFYQSEFINLDFHSIPHYGTESQMEKVWCGAKHQVLKGANTIFAQDNKSNAILYSRADILRKDEAQEVKNFVDYWKKIKQGVNETLVFDCKLTSYKVLEELNADNIKYITLRKRSKKLINNVSKITDWKRTYLPIPKRKHKSCSVHESEAILKKGYKPVRQIIIKDHGRAEPTFIITNNIDLKLDNVLVIYAKRWRIENKLSELISFFNLNALSSSLMVRIHFDILWTIAADTLYRRFAQDLSRFEHESAASIFKRFINMPGRVVYDGQDFIIKIRKRAHTPILMGINALKNDVVVPWLNNRKIKIQWTA